MTFTWPAMLALLVAIPAGAWLYRTLEHRRRQRLGALSGLGLGEVDARRRSRLRTRIPPVLFLLGLAVMTVALARPQATLALPQQEGIVILAFDVSGSMAATDLAPTRMAAAKAAATDFVQRQPSSVAIGVVAFSDAGLAVQAPTNDQATVLAAINRLAPQRGTSLGQGMLASLNAIAVAEAGASVDYYTNRSPGPSPSPSPVPAGSHTSAVVVLLTDGENNEAPDPTTAAGTAADQGIRIDTVGIGSPGGATLDLNGFRVHTQLNEALLQQVAQVTGGTYYSADSAPDLLSIYDSLDPRLLIKPQMIEVTGILAGVSLLLLTAGGVTSLAWLGRLS